MNDEKARNVIRNRRAQGKRTSMRAVIEIRMGVRKGKSLDEVAAEMKSDIDSIIEGLR